AAAVQRLDRQPIDETPGGKKIFFRMETLSIQEQPMTTITQSPFLIKLENALKDVPESRRTRKQPTPVSKKERGLKIIQRIRRRTKTERLLLLDTLMAEAHDINLNVRIFEDMQNVGSHIQQLASTSQVERGMSKSVVAWQHPLIQQLNLKKRLKEISVPLHIAEVTTIEEKTFLRETADFCVADSATLVLKTRAGQPRSVSLTPAIHIAVITLEQMLADLSELYALLQYDPEYRDEGLTRCMTFITGPSKTADIEAEMVYGVHGPREVYLEILAESPRV
ncbi:MAG: lactate utilization protein, partial [Deltaproteobacteria bacterium]